MVTAHGVARAAELTTIELFTAADSPVDVDHAITGIADEVDVYAIDGVQRLEAELSRALPADARAAKRDVLARIDALNESRMQPVRHAVLGLAKAMQYGLDRYPAIVFDRRAVVYGVTDAALALRRYRQWQEESEQ
jgi:integrating conjugative element protein (TIGR03757 family)